MSNYSMDIIRAIYNDKTGECFEVRPDRDALGLVEITYKCDNVVKALDFTTEQGRLIAKAILACCDELDPIKEGCP